MNVRLSILLVSVLVLFGGTFLIWQFFLRTPERTPDEDWMYRVSEDDLYRIEVGAEGENGRVEVVYTRAPGSSRWYIQGDPPVPVFNDKWAGTPLLLSGPRVNRTLAEQIDNPAAYGLDPPRSRVKVVDGSGQDFEFHMGITTPDGSNQYTRLVGHPALFTVPEIWAQVINRLALEPPYLKLYQLEEKDNVVFVQVTDDGKTIDYGWDIDRVWYYLGPPQEDSGQQDTKPDGPDTKIPVAEDRWLEVLEFVRGPRADDIAEDSIEDPSEYGLDPPRITVRLGKGTGADMRFYLGDSTPDGNHRYAMVDLEDGKLFTMHNDRVKLITGLVSDPPLGEATGATPPPG